MANTYPNSTLTFYKTQITKDLNALVDKIDAYLRTCPTVFIEYYMYQRHDLIKTIRVELSQSQQLQFDYNYLMIENFISYGNAEPRMFYFITNKRQINSNTIEFDIELDTVNSLGYMSEGGVTRLGNPRNFGAKTKIMRTHKDRFLKPATFDPSLQTNTLVRKIDRVAEEIVPTKLLSTDSTLRPDNDIDKDFYLIYKGSAAIETYLVANDPIKVGIQPSGVSKTITYTDLEDGKYYYYLDNDNTGGTFELNGISYTLGQPYSVVTDIAAGTPPAVQEATTAALRGLVLSRSGSKLLVGFIWSIPTASVSYDMSIMRSMINCAYPNNTASPSYSTSPSFYLKQQTSIEFTQAKFMRVSSTFYSDQTPEGLATLVTQTYGLWVGSGLVQTLGTIDDVDRTDSTLVKIIKYPYCPISFTYDDATEIWDFGSSWEYTGGLLKYLGLGVPTLGNNNVVQIDLANNLKYTWDEEIRPNDAIDIERESKLFHSDFLTTKINYDSFNLPIYLENLTLSSDPTLTKILKVDFKPTSTVNSKFAFKLDFDGVGVYNSVIDYDTYLIVTRNNEEIILNSAYLDYIKVGYNYDKKAQALQVEQAKENAIGNTIGSAVSVLASVLGVALGGPTVKAAGLIGLGTTIASGTVAAAKAWDNVRDVQASNENSLAAKMAQLQNQATRTAGTDDIDLLSYYNGNRLHYMQYSLTKLMRASIFNALYLTGYKTVEEGVPQVDTRYWFNYIQCDPVLNFEGIQYIKSDWVEDLKAKYNQGVTVFHNHGNSYNLYRTLENYETWIVEGVNI